MIGKDVRYEGGAGWVGKYMPCACMALVLAAREEKINPVLAAMCWSVAWFNYGWSGM